MPNPAEVATISVRGQKFEDWESVFVQHRWTEAWPLFRFTCAERDPIPDLWQKLQFKPWDKCQITLGGQPAIAGIITVRQAAYDAEQHGVMLQGVGITWAAARASIIHKTNNFDGKTISQVASEVLAPFESKPEVVGTLDETPFKRLQVQPGEKVWDFLERIARVRGTILGSSPNGNVLLIGKHTAQTVESLIEGVNILKMQCVIAVENIFSLYDVRGQVAANDEQNGREASEQEASVPGSAPIYTPNLTPTEQPVWNKAELVTRAEYESIWHEGTIINATVTVQGWLRPGGGLWPIGEDVFVKSPMAMLNQTMTINSATFTQDRNSGTLTTLELVPPWSRLDNNFDVRNPNAPLPPGRGQFNDTPPVTAPPFDPNAPQTQPG